MRIRTLKPEFWSHPVMVREDDATKLLAIGLLNYADDHGYFYAEPAMVRAALRPLDEDSTIIRRSIARLSDIGYILTFKHATHGLLGRVISFDTHQRVDRPADSKIRVIWGKNDSTINRRSIDDQSSLEQGNKGTREQGKGKEGQGTSFDLFWTAWPKKKAKEDARKAFHKVVAPIDQIIKAVESSKLTAEWQKERGKFIPHPATWLNGKRWEDEDEIAPSQRLLTPEEILARDKADEERQAEIFGKMTADLQRGMQNFGKPLQEELEDAD